MQRYVTRRVVSGVLVLLLLSFVTYLVVNVIPQNKACAVIRCTPSTPDSAKRAALHRAGLDRPIWVQYGKFVYHLVRDGSLGTSWGGTAVSPTIERALPATVSLVAGGLVLMLALALPLASFAALRPRSPTDRGPLTFSLAGIAIHPFVLGLGLRELFARGLGVPGGGYCPLTTHAVVIPPAAIYVETVFALPGLGHLAVGELSGEFGNYDLPTINAIVVTVGIFVVLLSVLADVASAWLDPRVRQRAL